jgi:hypothetical protein
LGRRRRYIVCLNEEERRKDAHDRQAIVAHLKEQLRNGDKSLVGNKGYRRYLKVGLEALQQVEAVFQDKRFLRRSQLSAEASAALRATGLGAPPTLRELP